MSNLLKEILDMQPVPYRWVDDQHAVFDFEGRSFGIYADLRELTLTSTGKNRMICNISFGVIKGEVFNTEDDLNTALTNLGRARVVFSTVGAACTNNREITGADVICLAGSDEEKERRSLLYSVALSEIQHKVPEFKRSFTIQAHTANGSIIQLLAKEKFTPEEQAEIKDKLEISK